MEKDGTIEAIESPFVSVFVGSVQRLLFLFFAIISILVIYLSERTKKGNNGLDLVSWC